MQLISIGHGNVINARRVIAILGPDSAPVKRMIQEARDQELLIDASCGRRTRGVLVMDTNHVILSSAHPGTLAGRVDPSWSEAKEDEEEKG